MKVKIQKVKLGAKVVLAMRRGRVIKNKKTEALRYACRRKVYEYMGKEI